MQGDLSPVFVQKYGTLFHSLRELPASAQDSILLGESCWEALATHLGSGVIYEPGIEVGVLDGCQRFILLYKWQQNGPHQCVAHCAYALIPVVR